jgi:linearmycin/streptolysin S transport system permease protein
MRAVALLVVKDLRRKLRAPLGLTILLAFPLLFAGMIALVFGSGGDAAPRVRLLVENLDGDAFLSRLLVSSLTSAQMAEHFDVKVVGADGAARMERGEASALLRIPRGFTGDFVDGTPSGLELVRNPAEGILPEIAEQLARVLCDGLDGGSRLLRRPLEQLRPYLAGDRRISGDSIAELATTIQESLGDAWPFVAPPVITLEGAFSPEAKPSPGKVRGGGSSQIFLLVLPGVAVYALFLVADQGMRDLLTETAGGTLHRQLAGPVPPATLLLAKVLYTAVISLLALGVLALVGLLLAGAHADLFGFLALSMSLILAVTGAAAVVYGFARTERLGATVASLVYLFLGMAGGRFIPLQSLPASVRAVAPLSPFYWGTRRFQRLVAEGAGLRDILPHAAVLAGLGAILLTLGAAALGRAARRGITA